MSQPLAERGGPVLAWVASAISALLGATSLVGWATQSEALTRAGESSGIPVLPWTGIGLILLAIALAARVTDRTRIAVCGAGAVLAIVTALVFSGHDGVAGLWFPDALARHHASGRPRIWTLFVFTVLALAIATGTSRRIARVTIGIATTAIAGVGLLGLCFSAYDAGPTPFAPQGGNVSIPVVIAAVLMAVALATWRHDIAPASLFVRRSLGGTLSRGILSTLVISPIIVGVLIIAGPERGWWSVSRGAVWLAALGIATPFVTAWIAGRYGDRVTQALRESEVRFRTAFVNAPIGIALVSIEGTWLRVNPALCEMFGRSEEDLMLLTWQELTHPDDLEADLALVQSTLAGEIDSYSMEKRYLRADGTVVWGLLSVGLVRDANGDPAHFISQIKDVSDHRAANDRLQELVLYDGLTGLANRSLFTDRLAAALTTSRPGHIAVVYLDLDRFKIINDSLGHSVGDELLVSVARRLEASIRPGDTAARLSGDEFAVLCDPVTGIEAAMAVAERIAAMVSKSSMVADRDVTVTASLGVAMSKADDTVESLLRNADVAMYRAKQQGRDRIEVFFDSLGALAQSRFEVEAAIRGGLHAEQFEVHYQTQNGLETGAVEGFEALVRWRHPQRGLLVPAQFLAVAEDAGLLGEIGDQVLRRAFAECGPMLAATTLTLAVNIIPAQVARAGFGEWLLDLLHDHGIAPEQLCLEMPETSLFATTGGAADALRGLAAHGVRLAVDDFGTGFASLSTLAELPISVLKIDRSFVVRLNDLRRNDDAIIGAVINLSDRLGIQVVAEGVETTAQADQLLALGCRYVQGFLYCRPEPWSELVLSPAMAAVRPTGPPQHVG